MKTAQTNRRAAFTLIELLVVIAIIAVLAALVVPLSNTATAKMRLARVTTDLNTLVTAIETYKLETGQYPPDHGDLKNVNALSPQFRTNAAMNPLFYELSGAIFTNTSPSAGEFLVVGRAGESIKGQTLQTYFKRGGIRNSARSRADIPFKGHNFKPSQSIELWNTDPSEEVELLTVPVPGPFILEGRSDVNRNAKVKFNPWFYDASSTNRNNPNSFDLWATILIGKQTNVIGNWKN